MKALRTLWRLFRLHAAGTYAVVVVCALGSGTLPVEQTIGRLLLLFVPFVVLLYGGIYTINGIADRREDALHATKRFRPVASGAISPAYAWIIAVTAIGCALLSAYVLGGAALTMIFGGFLALNAAYTFVAKRIPYLELLFNGSTYLLRGILGASIAGGALPWSVGWALFWAIVGVSTARRMGEMHDGHGHARPTLRFYTPLTLRWVYHCCTLMIVLAFVAGSPNQRLIVALFGAVHCLIAYGSERFAGVRRAAQW